MISSGEAEEAETEGHTHLEEESPDDEFEKGQKAELAELKELVALLESRQVASEQKEQATETALQAKLGRLKERIAMLEARQVSSERKVQVAKMDQASAETATQDELRRLKERIAMLEARQVSSERKDQAVETATQAELAELKELVVLLESRQAALEQKKQEETARPGYIRIPGMKSDIRAWASMRLQMIHDVNNSVENGPGYDCMHISSLPIPKRDRHATRAHVKETRFGVEACTLGRWSGQETDVRLFLESDLYGAQDLIGGENTTNQAIFRIRHAYVEWGPLIIGQYWGLFCDYEAFVDHVEFAPPVGAVSLRSPQMRYTHRVSDKLRVVTTVENPEGEYLDTNGKPNFTKANGRYALDQSNDKAFNNLVVDQVPDVGVSVIFNEKDKQHLSFRGAFRHLHTKKSDIKSQAIGLVVGAGGVFQVFGKDEVSVQVNGGSGVGRYVFETSGTAAFLDANGNLHTQRSIGGFLAYKHFWNKSLWSVLSVGSIYTKNNDHFRKTMTTNPVNKELHSVNANIHWRPDGFENMRLGVEYLWGQRKTERHGSSNLNRVMIGVKADF
jgi:hypothetical protein